jgi:ubiquinone/menaquinone biosynthesis C-methylase UbiE
MANDRLSLKEWGERLILKGMFKKYQVFDPVTLEVKDFGSDGLILDIGGGGEGVIGRLKGRQVVAIDLYQDELDEAPDGPQKIVMDARKLTFPDGNFDTATAFFSMMYMKTRSDHEKVLREAWRVLKPGGRFYLWDVDISKYSATKKEAYFVPLHYQVGGFKNRTGYGVKWPDQIRDEAYYIELAGEAGFQHLETERKRHVFFLKFSRQ